MSSNTNNILILGATSAMAQAWARLEAARGARFHLVGRNADKLAVVAQDLIARGASHASCHTADFSVPQDYAALVAGAIKALGHIDIALLAQGTLPDQRVLEHDPVAVRTLFETNTLSYLLPATELANAMVERRAGKIVFIGSVAGDRGRQSNYFYGASKTTISTFAEGLRNRLFKSGVQVITIKPGFVDTPMAAAFTKGPLWATPEAAAAGIDRAIRNNYGTAYVPGFWRLIMLVIRHIPDIIFKRLSL